MILTTILIILAILFMFSPIFLSVTGIVPYAHWFIYYTVPIGVVVIGIFGLIGTYTRNKRQDEDLSYEELKVESNPHQKYIKDEDKQFVLDHIEDFEERIGTGKSYYINSFLKKKTPFNGGAFFGGLFWLGYRGMMKEFFSVLGVFILFDIVTLISGINTDGLNLGIIVSGFFGLCGNYLYFSKLKKDIQKGAKPINPLLGLSIAIGCFAIYSFGMGSF